MRFSTKSRDVTLKTFKREWFYMIDHKGMLFLEETEPKNYTSSLKDVKFLDFFFNALQPNTTGQFTDYGWISPCWGEANFIRVYSHPVVFRMLLRTPHGVFLPYAGSLTTPFRPDLVMKDK